MMTREIDRALRRIAAALPALLLTGLLIVGCSGSGTQDPEEEGIQSWASVDSVGIHEQTETAVVLDIYGSMPNPCCKLNPPDVTYTQPDSILVRMSSVNTSEMPCATVIVDYADRITLPIPEPGAYWVKFYTKTGTSLVWKLEMKGE